MKTILLAILASFAVSYLTVQGLQSSADQAVESSLASAPSHDPVDIQRSMTALEEENRALSSRVTFLENQPAGGMRIPAAGDWVSKDELLALQDELRAATKKLAAASGPIVDLANPDVREELGTVLQDMRKAAVIKKSQAAQESGAANLETRLAKMQGQLGLNQTQVTQMRSALESKMEMDADITRRWQEGEDPESLGRIKVENRTTHQAELTNILTASQLEQYQERRQVK